MSDNLFVFELRFLGVRFADGWVVVDTAATQRDSLKCLAFVAAFAMSNYSSTIGRIAKPFNPMLVRLSSFRKFFTHH